MCNHHHSRGLPSFRCHRYSLDDTLTLCQERNVADATAYLLERKGDVTGALSLALRTLSSRLASLREALQVASLRDVAAEMAFMAPGSPSKHPHGVGSGESLPLPKGSSYSGGGSGTGGYGGSVAGGGGTAPRAGTAAWARWASKVALEGLQEVSEVFQIFETFCVFVFLVCVILLGYSENTPPSSISPQ